MPRSVRAAALRSTLRAAAVADREEDDQHEQDQRHGAAQQQHRQEQAVGAAARCSTRLARAGGSRSEQRGVGDRRPSAALGRAAHAPRSAEPGERRPAADADDAQPVHDGEAVAAERAGRSARTAAARRSVERADCAGAASTSASAQLARRRSARPTGSARRGRRGVDDDDAGGMREARCGIGARASGWYAKPTRPRQRGDRRRRADQPLQVRVRRSRPACERSARSCEARPGVRARRRPASRAGSMLTSDDAAVATGGRPLRCSASSTPCITRPQRLRAAVVAEHQQRPAGRRRSSRRGAPCGRRVGERGVRAAARRPGAAGATAGAAASGCAPASAGARGQRRRRRPPREARARSRSGAGTASGCSHARARSGMRAAAAAPHLRQPQPSTRHARARRRLASGQPMPAASRALAASMRRPGRAAVRSAARHAPWPALRPRGRDARAPTGEARADAPAQRQHRRRRAPARRTPATQRASAGGSARWATARQHAAALRVGPRCRAAAPATPRDQQQAHRRPRSSGTQPPAVRAVRRDRRQHQPGDVEQLRRRSSHGGEQREPRAVVLAARGTAARATAARTAARPARAPTAAQPVCSARHVPGDLARQVLGPDDQELHEREVGPEHHPHQQQVAEVAPDRRRARLAAPARGGAPNGQRRAHATAAPASALLASMHAGRSARAVPARHRATSARSTAASERDRGVDEQRRRRRAARARPRAGATCRRSASHERRSDARAREERRARDQASWKRGLVRCRAPAIASAAAHG